MQVVLTQLPELKIAARNLTRVGLCSGVDILVIDQVLLRGEKSLTDRALEFPQSEVGTFYVSLEVKCAAVSP